MLRPLALDCIATLAIGVALHYNHSMPADDPRRKPLRLTGFDYAQSAGYFVTLCAHDRRNLFGQVADGAAALSRLGQLAVQAWLRLPEWFPAVGLDCYVIMPNHIHGILLLLRDFSVAPYDEELVRAKHGFAPTADGNTSSGAKPSSLSAIIQAYKSHVSREWNRISSGKQGIWQRGFYDHVIRDEHGLQCIREYIANNPARWSLDKENSARTGLSPFYAWLEQHCSKLP
jgi:putative transposase